MWNGSISCSSRISLLAPEGEFDSGARIGLARVRIPYIGSEKLNETAGSVLVRGVKSFGSAGVPWKHFDHGLAHLCLLPPVSE
jgi:hypothetical protein